MLQILFGHLNSMPLHLCSALMFSYVIHAILFCHLSISNSWKLPVTTRIRFFSVITYSEVCYKSFHVCFLLKCERYISKTLFETKHKHNTRITATEMNMQNVKTKIILKIILKWIHVYIKLKRLVLFMTSDIKKYVISEAII